MIQRLCYFFFGGLPDLPEHPWPDSVPRQGQTGAYEEHHRQLLRHGRAAGKIFKLLPNVLTTGSVEWQ